MKAIKGKLKVVNIVVLGAYRIPMTIAAGNVTEIKILVGLFIW